MRRGRLRGSATAGLIVVGLFVVGLAACGPTGPGVGPTPAERQPAGSAPAGSAPAGSASAGSASTQPAPTGPAPAAGSSTAQRGSTAQPDGLLVRGTIHADGAGATFEPALAVDLAPHASDEGTHAIVLVGSDGTVVHTTRFTPDLSVAEPAEGLPDDGAPPSSFSVVVPGDLTAVTEVRLEADGRVLTTRAVSASPPTVSASIVPEGDGEQIHVAWTSSDADHDPLTHSVIVSADGGASWQLVAIDLMTTSVSLPRWSVPGTDVLVRVVVSDGVRSATATSTVALTNSAPIVEISSPVDGQEATGAQTVLFRASAFDPEDGSRDGAPVEWSSDLDGVLGTGAELLLRADQLSEGAHVITATAGDSAGGIGSADVTLRVRTS